MRVCPNCEFETEEEYCPRDHFPTIDKSLFGSTSDGLEGALLVGKYRIIRRLGAGGCGAVYQAHQLDMDRMVAIKVMLSRLSKDDRIVKRFYREVRTSSKLEHPNTIKIYDFGRVEDGTLYYAMQYLEGEPLAQVVRREAPLPEARVNNIATQICKSLAEAHDHGIVHRDLKPENVFMTRIRGEQDHVKVLDFGMAKLRHGDRREGTLTAVGQTFGTPLFMSPEQAQSKDVDGRADLYSLGVIMYEMLAGRVPFWADDTISVLMMQVKQPAPPLPEHLAIANRMRALVMQLLEKKPVARPADADEVMERLAAMASGGRRRPHFPNLPTVITAESSPATDPTLGMRAVEARSEHPTQPDIVMPACTEIIPQVVDPPEGAGAPTEIVPQAAGQPEPSGAATEIIPQAVGQPEPSSAAYVHTTRRDIPARAPRKPSRKGWVLGGAAAVVVLAVAVTIIVLAVGGPEKQDNNQPAASSPPVEQDSSAVPAAVGASLDASEVSTAVVYQVLGATDTADGSHVASAAAAEPDSSVPTDVMAIARTAAAAAAGAAADVLGQSKTAVAAAPVDARAATDAAGKPEATVAPPVSHRASSPPLRSGRAGVAPGEARTAAAQPISQRASAPPLRSDRAAVAPGETTTAADVTVAVAKPVVKVDETLIDTEPPGCRVLLGRRQLGKTPYTHRWAPRARLVELRLVLEGYRAGRITLVRSKHGGRTLKFSLTQK